MREVGVWKQHPFFLRHGDLLAANHRRFFVTRLINAWRALSRTFPFHLKRQRRCQCWSAASVTLCRRLHVAPRRHRDVGPRNCTTMPRIPSVRSANCRLAPTPAPAPAPAPAAASMDEFVRYGGKIGRDSAWSHWRTPQASGCSSRQGWRASWFICS